MKLKNMTKIQDSRIRRQKHDIDSRFKIKEQRTDSKFKILMELGNISIL